MKKRIAIPAGGLSLFSTAAAAETSSQALFITEAGSAVGWIDIALSVTMAAGVCLWGRLLFLAWQRDARKTAAIVAAVIFVIWYAGGFHPPVRNPAEFGEAFLYEALPHWSQDLFLRILPFWLTALLALTMFVGVVVLLVMIPALCYQYSAKYIPSEKLRMSIAIGLVFGGFVFIFLVMWTRGNMTVVTPLAILTALFSGAGHYFDFITFGGGDRKAKPRRFNQSKTHRRKKRRR